MAPRATENAKKPPPLDLAKVRATLAARAAEMDAAYDRQNAAQTETQATTRETELAREAEQDEGKFAKLGADFVIRSKRAVGSLKLAPPPADSNPERGGNPSSNVTEAFLVRKGEAQPSVIAPPPGEISHEPWSHAWDASTAATSAPRQSEALPQPANQPPHEDAGAGAYRHEEIEAALARARSDWEASEASRLAFADAQWQKRFEDALAEARAEAETTRDSDIELELNRLREEAAAMQAALVDRETALARECLAIEQTRESWQRESQEALSRAKLAWKAEEAARLAAAEAQWQEKSAKALTAVRTESETARDQAAERELNGLRGELTVMKAALADREKALVQAEVSSKADMKARLAAAEAQWQEESAKALADVRAEVTAARHAAMESERKRAREQAAALQAASAERDNALAEAEAAWNTQSESRFDTVNAQWQDKLMKALAEARAEATAARDAAVELERNRLRQQTVAMQAALAERDTALAQAKADWKAESEARLAAAQAQWQDNATKALAAARAEAGATRNQDAERELNRLRGELAAMEAAVADREVDLARADLTIARARESWEQEAHELLSAAETSWKAEEAARLAAAEAQWWEQTEIALVEARAEAGATPNSGLELELERLREEAVTMQAALVARETALARECLAIERSRESWQRETEEALAKAKADWKSEEAARLAAVEAQWQKATAKALAAARVQAAPADDSEMALEVNRLRNELATMQAALVEREGALAREYLAIERTRDARQVETQEALSRAKAAWKGEEVERLAAAETQWKKQASRAVAELTARCERAETSLAEASARAASSIREGNQHRPSKTEIVLKPDRIGFTARTFEQSDAQPKGHLIRNIVIAAALAVPAALFYPRIATEVETMFGGAPAPVAVAAPAAQGMAGQVTAVVKSAVNARTEPSASASIAWTLERGLKVTIVEERGNWTLVRADSKSDKGEPRQGWVYSSFLNARD